LGTEPKYLIKIFQGLVRANLFVELGSTLSPRYFTPERYAEAKARQARKMALLLVEQEKAERRAAKRAACESRRRDRLTRRQAKRAQRLAQPPPALPPERRLIDEELVGGLILQWQKTGDPLLFEKIIEACRRLIDYIILHYGFLRFEDFERDELTNEAVLNLGRALPAFRPDRSAVFPFLLTSVRTI
jgi:hypothetical protein